LGCAVALASLERFKQESIIERMQPKIASLKLRLTQDFLPLAHVADVRQWGFMIGIELVEDKNERRSYLPERRTGHKVILEARRRGVMIRPLGDVIILMPPLTITDEELTILLDVTRDSIQAVTDA
jgi:adenosylmethionine---8-amino-7-oxononanoate aminotransferase